MKIIIIILTIIASATILNAQTCIMPTWAVQDFNSFRPETTANTTFTYENPTGPRIGTWNLNCGPDNVVNFRRRITVNHLGKQQVYFKIQKRKFDCSTGSPLEVWTDLFVTTTLSSTSGGSNTFIHNFDISVERSTAYRSIAYVRHRILWIGWNNWNPAGAIDLVFGNENRPNPSGIFSNVLSIDSRTSNNGYNADVHQLDVDGAFNFDASPTSCESNWRYYIKEFNIANWSSSNAYASPVFNGQAGNIDMDAVYPHGFQRGKVYLLTLVAGHGWYSKNYWFEIKDATLVGKLSGPRSNESGHTVYLPCKGSVKLNTKGTESVDKWRVRVQPVNSSFSLIGTEASTGIVSGQVPLDIDLGSLYGSAFVLYQRYRVVYEITAPGDTRIYYFKYIICDRSSSRGGQNIEESSSIIKSEDLEIKIYPNPVMDNLSIQIAGTVNHKSQVNILNQLGQTVFEKSSFSQDGIIEINIQQLPKGIYFLKVVNGDDIITKKFIKN
jgi:hypothetical protein